MVLQYNFRRSTQGRLTRPPQVALGQSSMIAANSPKREAGFVEVITLTKIQGWIKASLLTPWHSLAFPAMKCHPALMSNGLLGFDYDKD